MGICACASDVGGEEGKTESKDIEMGKEKEREKKAARKGRTCHELMEGLSYFNVLTKPSNNKIGKLLT